MRKPATLALAAAACAVFAGAVQAQSSKLGAYQGTVVITGVETSAHTSVNFGATVKIGLPVTDAGKSSARAEADDVDKPSAMATITQWDTKGRNASPDSDGKITSWSCALAAPTEVPMNASGALDLDYRSKTYWMFVGLVAKKTVPLKCTNSRSGAYKKDELVALAFGNSEPGAAQRNELGYADAARLMAKSRLVPSGQATGSFVDMAWDLRLAR